MRCPSALDALARWLVLTLAGVGLLALFPVNTFGGRAVLVVAGVGSFNPIQVLGVGMVVVAWLLFVAHVLSLRSPWWRDPAALVLAAVALVAVAGAATAFLLGSAVPLAGLLAVAVAVQVALSIRIDLLQRPASVRRTGRRAVTAL